MSQKQIIKIRDDALIHLAESYIRHLADARGAFECHIESLRYAYLKAKTLTTEAAQAELDKLNAPKIIKTKWGVLFG